MLRRILVPLDGSAHAKAAVPVATDIAIRTDAQVRLVHVVEVPEALAYPEYRAEDRAWAEQELAGIAAGAAQPEDHTVGRRERDRRERGPPARRVPSEVQRLAGQRPGRGGGVGQGGGRYRDAHQAPLERRRR